jgi:hypothetical protein
VNALSIIKFLSPSAIVVSLLVLVISGCTTSNQESLGVGVMPAVETAAATPTISDPDSQTALAPAADVLNPAANAANSVAMVSDPAAGPVTKVGFLPITGAPQRTVSALSKALGDQSKRHAISITGAGDQSAEYRLKGYMSALNEGNSTTVTFYWDVLDKSNNRLYRINGFERDDGAKSDPWAGVSRTTMSRIAERTMDNLAGWLRGRKS